MISMPIKNYNELTSDQLDVLREIGSIGSGNAANALSSMIGRPVRLQVPEVRVMGYDEAIDWIGGPEEITAGVLVKMSGQINGIMLSVQQMDFINLVLENMLDIRLDDYAKIGELERSTMIEVGNIMISTFINALCGLADISINLTVPAFTVDMQGAIMAVPMAEYGGQSNYIMTIGSDFLCEGKRVPCRLLLSPDLRSLDFLMRKLGVGE
jgi:chemotaxis protein CheC